MTADMQENPAPLVKLKRLCRVLPFGSDPTPCQCPQAEQEAKSATLSINFPTSHWIYSGANFPGHRFGSGPNP